MIIAYQVIIEVHFFVCLDQHEQRLKALREKAKELEEDDWKFKPISELLGHR